VILAVVDIPIEIAYFFLMIMNSSFWSFLGFFFFTIIIGLGSLAAMIVAMVFLGRGIYLLKKHSKEIGRKHTRNMSWSWKLFWVYFGTVVFGLLFGFFFTPFLNIFWFSGLQSVYIGLSIFITVSSIVGWIGRICLILALILPLWMIALRKQRDLAYVYGGGTLLIAMISGIMTILIYLIPPSLILVIIRTFISSVLFSIIFFCLNLCIFLAYKQTIDTIKEPKKIEKNKKKLFNISYPLEKKFDKRIARPISIVILFLVIGTILGAGNGLSFYLSRDLYRSGGGGGDDIIIIPGLDLTYETISISGRLDEGSTEEIVVFGEFREIVFIHVYLVWQDERVRMGLRNEPDEFVLRSVLAIRDDVALEGMDSGSDGDLDIYYSAGEEEALQAESFVIEIELQNAGDITGRLGIITRENDTGNDYDLRIEMEYISFEEISH
jgi:hypothetical protein